MDTQEISNQLKIGESVAVEFKRCGNGITTDVYETVCSFLNRFGGDIYLGVLDDGNVVGVPEHAAPDLVRNFISTISNPDQLSPTVYIAPRIVIYEGKTIIHIHVHSSSEVHRYKKHVYDRIDDADVKITSTTQLAQMYIRKQEIFTERKIYPFLTPNDLRLDLLQKIKILAANMNGGSHPWQAMKDDDLFRSARLYTRDSATGEYGFNLAAVMLLGKDETIADIVPAYMTDALLRKDNIDRYDDREIIQTNLIESYEQLMNFARKHLPDKFYLEDDQRRSIRNIIAREMIGNTLIHREYTSSYQAKFIIERNKIYVENANRAGKIAQITPENLDPAAKNPIIAGFFRNIGYADQLGSGVRNMFKYTRYYAGADPIFEENDIFRITVPLDENLLDDTSSPAIDKTIQSSQPPIQSSGTPIQSSGTPIQSSGTPIQSSGTPIQSSGTPIQSTDKAKPDHKLTNLVLENKIITTLKTNPTLKLPALATALNLSLPTVKYHVRKLQRDKKITRQGNTRNGIWIVLI